MSGKTATDSFSTPKSDLRELTHHDDPDVALTAKIMLKHRYGEEVSLP